MKYTYEYNASGCPLLTHMQKFRFVNFTVLLHIINIDLDAKKNVTLQAHNHWFGWSGFILTTFIQLYNIDLVNSVTLQIHLTILQKTLLYSNIFT